MTYGYDFGILVYMEDAAMAFREFRAKHDKTQRELADMLGLSTNQVARVERGERNTKKATLMLLERLDKELSEARNQSDESASSH